MAVVKAAERARDLLLIYVGHGLLNLNGRLFLAAREDRAEGHHPSVHRHQIIATDTRPDGDPSSLPAGRTLR